jgi:hypothetical protein
MSAPDESDKNIFLCTRETLAECGLRTTVADIETFVAQYDADVLIIHTWRLLVGPDENDAAVVTATLKELFYIRRNNPRLAMVLTDDLRQGKGSPPVRLRDDPAAWVESISGHHALVGHVDACFGLEREVDESGDELIVFGGVGRNPAPSALLLDEHEPTLSFAVRAGEDAARTIMTAWEFEIWGHAKILGRFTFTQLLNHVSIPNRKIVASTLRKERRAGVCR